MKSRQWMRAGLMALLMGVTGGAGQAWGQSEPVTLSVKTDFSHGEAGDQVVASVVETGVRTGASQVVTLQLVDAAGVVVAQTTGTVDQDTPLRLVYRVPTASAVFARVFATVGVATFSVAVVTVERWSPEEPEPGRDPVICHIESAMPRPPPPPPGPVTIQCERVPPPPPQLTP
ncbi:hypothetical protein [Corallococcus macrosporus]|nr:hypothetical protein [Corallococcus macrosporus]